MLVNLPTENGYVPVNPDYVTHVRSGVLDANKSVVHLDSGVTGSRVIVLGNKVDVARFLNKPDHAAHYVDLDFEPLDFPGPGVWTSGDGEFPQDWLDAQWVHDQWECFEEGRRIVEAGA